MIELNINQVPLFNTLPQNDLTFLKKTLPLRVLDAGAVIIREHEIGDRMFIILSGEVAVYKALGTSEQYLMTILTAGDFIGEMSLINRDMTRTASIVARTSIKLLEISQTDFDGLLKRRPALAVDIMRVLSTRLRETDNATIRNLQKSNQEITHAYDETLEGWAKALELRDQGTEGHTRRVTDMTVKLANSLDITGEKLDNIRRGAMLHDIGKMGIPDLILLKPGRLTDDEWVIMRKHPIYARDMLYPIVYLRGAVDIPYCHHEKWDGSGYPRGLVKKEIPVGALIFAIVDVWDALTSERPYRKAMPKPETLAHIRSLAGSHFGPAQVEAFIDLQQKQKNAQS
jgi:HD-GYP domain-containing protein (c-di-GMP phosphodiesterase class II)